ncbi:MAG: hypothetical protein R8M14_00005 [Ghiorsea sp.]
MQSWINITKLTFLEVFQARTYRILLSSTFLVPIFGFLLSSLFLVDLGKVYMDGMIGMVHLFSIVFILFVAVGLLSKDIEQKICYFLLSAPATRISYLFGRFTGLLGVFALMLLLIALESSLAGYYYVGNIAEIYQSGFVWTNVFELIFLHSFQYIALLGFVFFVFSWASGAAEIMLFSTTAFLFSWVFPPILLALQNPEVASKVPPFIYKFLEFLYQLLPHLNGSSIALEIAHGKDVSFFSMAIYCLEHASYTAVFLMIAIWFFSRRDL